MNIRRKNRLWIACAVLAGLALTIGLVLYALRSNIDLAEELGAHVVTMHGDDMAYLSDAHDGRLYCYYRTRAVVLNTGKNELFSCEAAGYDNTTSGFSTTAPVLGEPLTPLRRYYGDSRIRTERVLRANYLATINDLPKSVEKTADKTMKVIYTLRRGG